MRALTVRFDEVRADACIAGVSNAGRFAAAAMAAGFDAMRIVLPDGEAMPEDVERIWPGGVRAVGASEAEAGLSGRYLPSPEQLREMAETGGLAPSDAIDLGDPARARRAIIRATAKASDGVISRTLNRPVSQAITGLVIDIPWMRPIHMTVFTAFVGLAMLGAILADGATGLLVGALLFHAASVLDGVDGELARATFRSSSLGAKLDTRTDLAINLGFFFGLTAALVRIYGWQHAIASGVAVAILVLGTALLGWLLARSGQRHSFDGLKTFYRRRYPAGVPRAIVEGIIAITSRDFIAFGCAVYVVLGAAQLLSWSLLASALLWLGAILAAAPAILREGVPPQG